MDHEEFMEFWKEEERLEVLAAIILDRKRPNGDRWRAIRSYYRLREGEIASACKNCRWAHPYAGDMDWTRYFSPIEYDAWQSIRPGPVPLFPQFPVGCRFVDFGNPHIRVALECDSKTWHDRERDIERDGELRAAGWTTFRVSSTTLAKAGVPWEDLQDMREETRERTAREWVMGTIDGVLLGIRWHYYGPFQHYLTDYFDEDWAGSWLEATLREHCYLTPSVGGFEIGDE